MNARIKTSALMTQFALNQMMNLDRTLIGTRNYMGIAYFWAYAYRHALRDCSQGVRVKVHDAFMRAGLPPDGESPEHEAIVQYFCH